MVIETRIQAAPTTEPNDDDNLLIDGRQLAEWLGLSPRTLEIWRWRGGGPAYVKIGKAVRYRKGTVRQWMASREYENTSQY
ncbi:MAG TPA: helix-turn-helix domain-containing protein [bacterium]|nr:helix-turn-helix domain-containing protein [bacterium]HOL96779.1 helix-turn-helix domain-containing protein [bacterium]